MQRGTEHICSFCGIGGISRKEISSGSSVHMQICSPTTGKPRERNLKATDKEEETSNTNNNNNNRNNNSWNELGS